MVELNDIIEQLNREKQRLLNELEEICQKIARLEVRKEDIISNNVPVYNTNMDRDKLISLCKSHNYNNMKTQIAVKFFVEKEKAKDVWLWLCDQKYAMEWDTVYHLKWKMKKELFGSKEQNKK